MTFLDKQAPRWPLVVVAGLGLGFGLGFAGCGSSPKATTLQCVLNSDCSGSLVCAQGYCVSACVTSRDCSGDARCIILPGLGNVCQAPAKQKCAYNSECSPLVCGVDLECRNQCQSEVDCPSGQKCTTISKLCVDPVKDALHYDSATNELIPPPDAGVRDAGSSGQAGAGGPGGSAGVRGSAGAAGANAGKGGASMAGAGGHAGSGGAAGAGGAPLSPSCSKPGNNALHFGGGQWVTIPDAPKLHPTDLTIEAWVNFATAPGASFEGIVAKPNGAAIADSFEIYYYEGQIQAGVALVDDTTPRLKNSWSPVPGRWYHIALSYDHAAASTTGFGKEALYIDGVLQVSADAPALPTYDAHSVYLGADSDNGGMAGGFIGDIDEVAIWPSARSGQQIAADIQTCMPASFVGMIAYWTLDQGTGQVVGDSSPNANSGYLGSIQSADAADPTWIFSSVPWGGDYTLPALVSTTSACGKPRNRALHFSGGQYAVIADPVSLNVASFTIEAWVNYAVTPIGYANGVIVHRQFGTGIADSVIIYHPDSSHLACGGGFGTATAGFTPVPGTWYHLACTVDAASGGIALYLNDNLAASGTATGAVQYDTGAFLVGAGQDYGSVNSYFRGDIDEVMFWSSARTPMQVTADMQTCTPASLVGLAAYWSFDDVSGQVATDATANHNTLQLGSAITADGADPTWIVSTVPF